jgi:cell division protein FtsI/penicillin-binding protein 2
MEYSNYYNKGSIASSEDSNPPKKFWKAKFFFFLIVISIFVIIARLFYVQIIQSEKYQKLAKAQNEAKYLLKPQRGNIYDRNGKLLASSVEQFSFAIDPSLIEDSLDMQKISGLIAASFDKDSAALYKTISEDDGFFVWLARGIKKHYTNGLDTFNHPAFIVKKEPQRNYLHGQTCLPSYRLYKY